jgi:signal transduction histidine kinase
MGFACGLAAGSGCSGEEAIRRDVGKELRAFVHELNNPLAVMMGFTQLILLDDRPDGKMRADLDKVYSEMKRVARAVEKLHAYALSLQQQRPARDGHADNCRM